MVTWTERFTLTVRDHNLLPPDVLKKFEENFRLPNVTTDTENHTATVHSETIHFAEDPQASVAFRLDWEGTLESPNFNEPSTAPNDESMTLIDTFSDSSEDFERLLITARYLRLQTIAGFFELIYDLVDIHANGFNEADFMTEDEVADAFPDIPADNRGLEFVCRGQGQPMSLASCQRGSIHYLKVFQRYVELISALPGC